MLLFIWLLSFGVSPWPCQSGCKFSLEEERVVIELQAQLGNRWAKIASYLPGRTDNDVKNFWSSRQKRLARILQTSATPKSQKNKTRVPSLHDVPILQVIGFERFLYSGLFIVIPFCFFLLNSVLFNRKVKRNWKFEALNQFCWTE